MASLPLPVRVVVFASEQLFPALQFLLHAVDTFKENLGSVHIYCTPDERRSQGPARRLERAVKHWCESRNFPCTIHITTGQMWPDDVRAGLLEWFNAAPNSHWVVNVTGGTKPMAAAAIEITHAAGLPSKRVIYQEIAVGWVELIAQDDGLLAAIQLDAQTDSAVPPADALDRLLSIADLVATQFSESHYITTQPVIAMPVDMALQSVMAQRWGWQSGLRALPIPVQSISNGDAFEKFIGAGLLDRGLSLCHSLKVIDNSATGKTVREIDLVACHRGRLVLIDIKLPGAQHHAKGTQLADIVELAHSLGGHGALAIAVRPGWDFDPDIDRLAKALGVRVATQDDAPHLFTRLLHWIDLGLEPGPAISAAQNSMQSAHAKGNTVLSDGRKVDAVVPDSGILHLPSTVERICERRREPWAWVQLDVNQHWLSVLKKHLSDAVFQSLEARLRDLHDELQALSEPGWLYFRESNALVQVQITLRTGVKSAALRLIVQKYLG
jgi:hypothetical protein